MYKTKAFAASSKTSPLAAASINRRDPGDQDVQIDIRFLRCLPLGSSLRSRRVEQNAHRLSFGHEIVGRVSKVPARSGDLAGVGCMVDSIVPVQNARRGLAVLETWFLTYGSTDPHLNEPTHGGYSDSIVWSISTSAFTFRIISTWRQQRPCSAPES